MNVDHETKQNKIIAYYCFGINSVLEQTIFSCSSAIAQLRKNDIFSDYIFIIFTDKIDFFSKFKLSVQKYCKIILMDLSKDNLLSNWKGEPPDNFRIKLKSLEYCCEKFLDSKVLLLDSDTVFIAHPDDVFAKISITNSLFHEYEGRPEFNKTPGHRHFLNFIKDFKFDLNEKRSNFNFPVDMDLYNAGVIGLESRNVFLVKEALAIHNVIFEKTKFYYTEQLSITYTVQNKTKIQLADKEIAHYWYYKEIQTYISKYLKKVEIVDDYFNPILILDVLKKLPSYKKFKSFYFKIPYKIIKSLKKRSILK